MRRRHIVLSALVSLVGLALLSLAFVSWSEGQATQGEYKIGVLEPSPDRSPSKASATSTATRSCATSSTRRAG